MGGAGGILGTDTARVAAAVAIAAAATIFLFKSGYAFLAPLSFAFCCRRVYALDTRGERERVFPYSSPLYILIYLLFGRQ